MVHKSHHLPAVVKQLIEICDGTFEITLVPTTNELFSTWEPGAHIDVVVPGFGIRQYSLIGDCGDPNYWKFAVQKEEYGRGASKYLCEELKIGDFLEVGQPRNNFPLEQATKYCFIAGGIGITGLLPMIENVGEGEENWRLYFLGKNTTRMPYVQSLRSKYPNFVHTHQSENDSRINLQVLIDQLEVGTEVYACGPEGLLNELETLCGTKQGIGLHIERFTPRTISKELVNTEFIVECKKSQLEVVVPEDESVFMALDFAGIELEGDCMEGTCGACVTTVLGGVVDHRDSVLSANERSENNKMLICVSRSLSPKLIVDL